MCSCCIPRPEVLYFPLFQHEVQTVEWLSLVLLAYFIWLGIILAQRILTGYLNTELYRGQNLRKGHGGQKKKPGNTALIWKLKGWFTQKWKLCHHLFNVMLFQMHMTFLFFCETHTFWIWLIQTSFVNWTNWFIQIRLKRTIGHYIASQDLS